MREYFKLIRVKHYLKNLLIFLPLVFSCNFFDNELFFKAFFAFCSFCFAASIIYVINDIRDVEKDQKHPTKKNRPLAAGRISIRNAYFVIVVLGILSILFFYFSGCEIYNLIYILIYIIINVLYSLGLKNIPIIDISILTAGFLIRVLFGGSVIDVEVSNWLYLTVVSFAFYFSLGKRRNEINMTNNETREVLKYYSKDFLDKNMYMCLAIGIVFYSLWTMSYTILPLLVWTVPLIIIILMKYSMDVEIGGDGDPIEVVYNDKTLLALIFGYAIILMTLIYFL